MGTVVKALTALRTGMNELQEDEMKKHNDEIEEILKNKKVTIFYQVTQRLLKEQRRILSRWRTKSVEMMMSKLRLLIMKMKLKKNVIILNKENADIMIKVLASIG